MLAVLFWLLCTCHCRQEGAAAGQAPEWRTSTQSPFAVPAATAVSSVAVPAAVVSPVPVPAVAPVPAVSVGAAMPTLAAREGSQEKTVTEEEVHNTDHVFGVVSLFAAFLPCCLFNVDSHKQKAGTLSEACKQQK